MLSKVFSYISLFVLSLGNGYLENNCYYSTSPTRPNITFIMGEDESTESYYTLAQKFYSNSVSSEMDFLVDTCRSLNSISHYLRTNIPPNVEGWGDIDIVVHGNPWSGLSTKTHKDGSRVSVSTIFKAMQHQELSALDNTIVDSNTTFYFQSCGLGSNHQLIEALQMAFGGFDIEVPRVRASKDFVSYAQQGKGQITRKNFEAFYVFYRTAYQPPLIHLKRDLNMRYPKVDIDWLSVLLDDQKELENPIKVKRFNLPVEWKVPFIPKYEGAEKLEGDALLSFIEGQEGLKNIITDYDIPIEKFRWRIFLDQKSNTLLIKGKATVMCVLRERI